MAKERRLTEAEKRTVERWIGKGPKAFTLLYAITRDGCDASTFHQNCDNQGPTVTVLYNQHGSLYGGYASANWDTTSQFVHTKDTFLFQLRYNDRQAENKFEVKQHRNSMYCGKGFGPRFGNGDDLRTFTGEITKDEAGGFFPLNGNMCTFGVCFDSHGVEKEKVNSGTMNVTELEVYRVSDLHHVNTPEKVEDILSRPLLQTTARNKQTRPSPGKLNVFRRKTSEFVLETAIRDVISTKLVEQVKIMGKLTTERANMQLVAGREHDTQGELVENDVLQVFPIKKVMQSEELVSMGRTCAVHQPLGCKNEMYLDDTVRNVTVPAVEKLRSKTRMNTVTWKSDTEMSIFNRKRRDNDRNAGSGMKKLRSSISDRPPTVHREDYSGKGRNSGRGLWNLKRKRKLTDTLPSRAKKMRML